MPHVLNAQRKLPRPDDPQILESIYNDMQRGMPLRHAAIRAGISESTAYHWVMDGTTDDGDPVETDGELGSHGLFVQNIKEADASCVDRELTKWDAGGKDWPGAATKLERRFPQDFGKNQRIEVESKVTVTHQLTMPDVAMNQLLEIVRTRLEQKLLTEQITVEADGPA